MLKVITTIFISILLSNAIFAAPPFIITPHQNITNAQIESYLQTWADEAKYNPFELSMLLIAAGTQRNKTLYHEAFNNFLNSLQLTMDLKNTKQAIAQLQQVADELDQPLSYYTWLLSRAMIAAQRFNDQVQADLLAQLTRQLLITHAVNDSYNGRAWSYLLRYYSQQQPELYQRYRHHVYRFINQLEIQHVNPIDILWARVLELQAAAQAKDTALYHDITTMLAGNTHTQWSDRFKHLPRREYPAWALSLARLAAITMQDVSAYQNLQQPLKQAMASSRNSSDVVLAWVNEQLALIIAAQHPNTKTT
ncbi:MAG: hypothetical protein Tsb005_11810 [Gammaproteobacteria bacterium]